MQTELTHNAENAPRTPWNKAKMIGSKPPLRTKDVWSIRTKLQVDGRLRDLAMFNLAIDSKLRGCDVVSLKVEDIAPHGTALDRAAVRQRKTGHPVRSNSPSRHGRRSAPTSRRPRNGQVTSSSPAGASQAEASLLGNTRGSCPDGSPVSAWMPASTAPTR